MACRAPFMQDTDLFSQIESQAVFYLQMRFKQLSKGVANSEFTGKRERGHLLSKSHYRHVFRWARKLPVSQVLSNIEGWDEDPKNMELTPKNSFPLYKNNTEEREDSAAKGTPNKGSKAKGKAKKGDEAVNANVVFGAWKRPSIYVIVRHASLRKWVAELGVSMHAVELNDDLTSPCCSLCNDIFDCWARMRMYTTERGLVPPRSVTVVGKRGTSKSYEIIPDTGKARKNRAVHIANLGCLVAYYMHGSMISLLDYAVWAGPAVSVKKFQELQPLLVLLMWIPLHLVCLEAELQNPMSDEGKGKASKAAHNYLGNMDLVIAYYMWLCAQTADRAGGEFEFDRFCVTCVKEIVDSPPPVWDSHAFPRLSDYIFDEACPGGEANIRPRIAYVSDRLVQMYREVFAPLVPLVKGFDCSPSASPTLRDGAVAFFLSGAEAKEFMTDYTPKVNPDNIKYFIDHAGIGAVLWQLRRYLSKELPALRDQLDGWIVARLRKEYANIARNAPEELSADGAQVLYCMQNALRPRAILGARGQLGSGAELAVIRTGDPAVIADLIKRSGRCSVWKAAHRLRKWGFTSEARQEQSFYGAARRRRAAEPVAGAFH